MIAEQFVYWLQGHFEMNPENNTLTEEQIKMIKTHLGYVFKKPITVPTSYTPQGSDGMQGIKLSDILPSGLQVAIC